MSEQRVLSPGDHYLVEDPLQGSVALPERDGETTRRQYRLPLRGHSLNPMIDAATPLLAW